jgi:hypothetical protein
MKSVKAHFEREEKKNPGLGLYYVLMKAARGKKFSPLTIKRAFTKYVPKDDYPDGNRHGVKNILIAGLIGATNGPEEVRKKSIVTSMTPMSPSKWPPYPNDE